MIRTRELCRTFTNRGKEIDAVIGVNLAVGKGEIFGLLGPKDAGKTTTLRMLVTLLRPTSGEAAVAGVDLLREPAEVRRRIGYVAQRGGLDPRVSARAELMLAARLHGMSRKQAIRRTEEMLDALRINCCADRPIGTYTSGQRRRLDLAVGLIHRPPVLFLDEPTDGLDSSSRGPLWEEIRRLRRGGTSVFITTHDLDEADALCDRIGIMDGGRIVVEGAPKTLKRDIVGDAVTVSVDDVESAHALLRCEPFVRESAVDNGVIRLYVDNGEIALPYITRLFDGVGLGVHSIAISRPTLDDVFLRHTGRLLAGKGHSLPYRNSPAEHDSAVANA